MFIFLLSAAFVLVQKWDVSERWATRKHHNEEEPSVLSLQVHEAVIPSALALSSPCGSFQPLFPGSDELDHISKVREVIGMPGNKARRVPAVDPTQFGT